MKISRPFREYHPAVKALIFMLPIITLTVFLHHFFFKQEPDAYQILKAYFLDSLNDVGKILDFIIFSPIKEELLYRGPAWVILWIFLLCGRRFERRVVKINCYILASLILILANFLWAADHYYPITAFGYGLVLGWLMLYTKNICYPILFHVATNAIGLLAIAIGYRIIY